MRTHALPVADICSRNALHRQLYAAGGDGKKQPALHAAHLMYRHLLACEDVQLCSTLAML